eukprot:431001_1
MSACSSWMGVGCFSRAMKVSEGKGRNFYETLSGAAAEIASAALEGRTLTKTNEGHAVATIAGGCFWGLELAYQRQPGVVATAVGYTQGWVETPSYDEVCSGNTGHTEAVQVFYDPKKVEYRDLLGLLFSRINPTTVNAQGNDRGTHYRTGVYTHTPEDSKVADEVFAAIAAKYTEPIATELKDAVVFWPAEDYHQQYLSKGGRNGSCQSAEKDCKDPIRCYG